MINFHTPLTMVVQLFLLLVCNTLILKKKGMQTLCLNDLQITMLSKHFLCVIVKRKIKCPIIFFTPYWMISLVNSFMLSCNFFIGLIKFQTGKANFLKTQYFIEKKSSLNLNKRKLIKWTGCTKNYSRAMKLLHVDNHFFFFK